MDIHEYVYLKGKGTNCTFRCRYCNEQIKDITIAHASIVNNIDTIEKEAVVHLLECKKFGDIRKSEIDEDV